LDRCVLRVAAFTVLRLRARTAAVFAGAGADLVLAAAFSPLLREFFQALRAAAARLRARFASRFASL
jgi:hypothetical protein